MFTCRLGGIPVGVVAVETRTVEMTIPADPANLDSESKVRNYWKTEILHNFYFAISNIDYIIFYLINIWLSALVLRANLNSSSWFCLNVSLWPSCYLFCPLQFNIGCYLFIDARWYNKQVRCGSRTPPTRQLRPSRTLTENSYHSLCLQTGGDSLGAWKVS